MTEIKNIFQLDYSSIVISIFIILSAIIAAVNIIGRFSEIIGRPVKWIKKKNEDHELLINTSKGLLALEEKQLEDVKQSIRHDKIISDKLENLTKMFLDKQIDDMRYEILDFASALSTGRKFSKEQFDHVLNTYRKYENILEQNNLSNGQVTTSMEVINEIYKDELKKALKYQN
ncbi:MAG: hypothetical protein K2M78_12020 [Lachnospiraceae bacterium]|nr:hypothetical protein [Lachnospiraceae bacterium]